MTTIDEEEKKIYFDPEILKQPTPQWMKDIGYIELEITVNGEKLKNEL